MMMWPCHSPPFLHRMTFVGLPQRQFQSQGCFPLRSVGGYAVGGEEIGFSCGGVDGCWDMCSLRSRERAVVWMEGFPLSDMKGFLSIAGHSSG